MALETVLAFCFSHRGTIDGAGRVCGCIYVSVCVHACMRVLVGMRPLLSSSSSRSSGQAMPRSLVCVRACVRACMRAYVRARVPVCAWLVRLHRSCMPTAAPPVTTSGSPWAMPCQVALAADSCCRSRAQGRSLAPSRRAGAAWVTKVGNNVKVGLNWHAKQQVWGTTAGGEG